MRLTDGKSLLEQVTVKQFKQNLVLLRAKEIEIPRAWILELLGTIEALQQENERIQDCYAVTNDHWKRLAAENEIFRADITDANIQMGYRDNVISKQCEALKVARVALENAKGYAVAHINEVLEALAKIAEVMGE